jgi:hypothetical protein
VNAAHDTAADAATTARRAGGRHAELDLARWGLVARGALYLVVAVLAFALAFGRREQPSSEGAIRVIGHEPLGAVLLVALASGLGAYAAWRVLRALSGGHDARGRRRDVGSRLADAGRAVLYGGLALVALEFVFGRDPRDAASVEQEDWTGRVLHWPGGRVVVVLVGVAIVAAGGWVTWRGVTGRFGRDLHLEGAGPAVRTTVSALAKVGIAARSVVAALVGAFLIEAAVTFDARRSSGIDGALAAVRHHAYGPVLLVLLALGLAAYGLYSLAEARYGEDPAP